MSTKVASESEPAASFLAFYDDALPEVYGYLARRCGASSLAEDLTSETFLAAVDAVRREGPPPPLGMPWIIGVARHKLADHWRREARHERSAHLLEHPSATTDPWEGELEAFRTQQVLGRLGVSYRAALSLRYLDDLPVAEVADLLGRSLHATEALLVRARTAFRHAYFSGDDDASGEAEDA